MRFSVYTFFKFLEELLGYYKYPKNCNHEISGNCPYKVNWVKDSRPNEIRFNIEVKGANTTSLGFAPKKTFVSYGKSLFGLVVSVIAFYSDYPCSNPGTDVITKSWTNKDSDWLLQPISLTN